MRRRGPKAPAVERAWETLRALRALPLVAATTTDASINGGDAVHELVTIRAMLDRALRGAPQE
jgi:hypothetical protein